MYNIILAIHVIVCALVILIVLIQAGRSGGFSGLMGGGGGDALFSTSSQQSGLRKATVILAGLFMATSLFLTILSSRRSGQSVLERSFPNLPPIQRPATTPVEPQAGGSDVLPVAPQGGIATPAATPAASGAEKK